MSPSPIAKYTMEFPPRRLFTSTIVHKTFFVLSFLLMMVVAESVVGKPEKIFRHDRMDPQKLPRVDLDNEELKRALEDLRRRVPEYTGYLFVDVVVEVLKMLFIFLLRLVGQQQRHSPIPD